MKRKNVTKEMMKGYMAEALLQLMLKKNYNDITIGEITEKAGVNRSTFYRNFDSKEAIVEFYISDILKKWMVEYMKGSDRSAEHYLLTIYQAFYDKKDELLRIHKNKLSYLFLPVLNKSFAEHLDIKELTVLEQYQRYHAVGGIYNFILLWLEREMKETPKEIAAIGVLCYPEGNMPKYLD